MCDVPGVGFNLIALFKYLSINHPSLKIRYFINNNRVVKKFRIKYRSFPNVKFTSSVLKGAFYRLRSYVFFCEQVINPFMCSATRRESVISLWHGMGLKKIGHEANAKLYFTKISKTFSKQLCYSDFCKTIMKRSFLFSDDKALISQNPRNDEMYVNKGLFYKEFLIERSLYKKVVLWLPTFRTTKTVTNSNVDFPLLTSQNLPLLNRCLSELHQLLIIKLHPAQKEIILFKKSFSNIIVIETDDFLGKKCEFYNLLGDVDAIITDYSSVAFDFMQLSRPIGYVIDDFDSYFDNRGFNVSDPRKYMPGPQITTMDQLLSFFQNLPLGDSFSEERDKIRDTINAYSDNHNCKRVVNEAFHD